MNSIRNRVYAGEIAGGADTVEYVIVAIVAVVIGAALIAFGNQMRDQMDKTGTSITQWFDKARTAAGNSANKIDPGKNPGAGGK
ncbi:hypothetical protein DW037_01920 [Collinsella sp. AF39-11AT]|uniref:hypothetical protein n=1 Tax=Collinsella sp. AF39-11AT TaxID=2292016 RepID=UPI000E491FC7|nr:hypothetical protein [Collinsella sp. AF39-11AT]RHL07703.1 hypothetical protein DW037_01920 [Collinsella sp. AF39-11AT]